MKRYQNQTVAELIRLIEANLTKGHAKIFETAELLFALHSRGESHYLMREGVFKFYREIANKELSPLTVMTFIPLPSLLHKLKGLPLEEQERIARGEPIPVVEVDVKGGIKTEMKPVIRMAQAQIDLAIDNGRLVPVPEQEKKARANAAKAPVKTTATSRVRVDKTAKLLVFGAMKFSPEDLRDPLRELGFKLTRI